MSRIAASTASASCGLGASPGPWPTISSCIRCRKEGRLGRGVGAERSQASRQGLAGAWRCAACSAPAAGSGGSAPLDALYPPPAPRQPQGRPPPHRSSCSTQVTQGSYRYCAGRTPVTNASAGCSHARAKLCCRRTSSAARSCRGGSGHARAISGSGARPRRSSVASSACGAAAAAAAAGAGGGSVDGRAAGLGLGRQGSRPAAARAHLCRLAEELAGQLARQVVRVLRVARHGGCLAVAAAAAAAAARSGGRGRSGGGARGRRSAAARGRGGSPAVPAQRRPCRAVPARRPVCDGHARLPRALRTAGVAGEEKRAGLGLGGQWVRLCGARGGTGEYQSPPRARRPKKRSER
jgi:hypothetical protein